MTHHSPAPWTTQPNIPVPFGRTSTCIRDARNICVAEVGHVDSATDGEEQEANARLIGAAPDLLAALRDCLTDAEGYLGTHDAGPAAGERIRGRCDRARAALAKAMGK